MVVDEGARRELFIRLEDVLGDGPATTLMELVAPMSWNDIATKQDLEMLRVATKQDLDELRVATKQDLEELRTEMQAQGQELRTEMQAQGQELRTEMQAQGQELRKEMQALRQELSQELQTTEHRVIGTLRGDLLNQTRSMIFAMIGTMITTVSLVLGAVSLG